MLRAGLVFIHVPRTAGSSISHHLYGQFLGHFSLAALVATGSPALLALPRLAVVRNPWDRLVSAFLFARHGGGIGRFAARAAPHVRREIAQIEGFERFVKEWLPGQDLARLDGVFRPQVHYLRHPDGGFPFDHIGRFEHLRPTEEWLAEVLARPVDLPRANEGVVAGFEELYDAEMREIVGRFYADDFREFGYR